MDYSGNSSGGNFKQPNVGLQAARIYKIVDIGTQTDTFEGEEKVARKMIVFFELSQKMEDGKPYSIFKEYNQAIKWPNATLRKHWKSWKGKDMTDEEVQNFDARSLLGETCMVNLVLSNTKKAKVDNLMAVIEGVPVPAAYNEQVFFDLDAKPFPQAVFDELPKWIKEKIDKSPEYESIINPEAAAAPAAGAGKSSDDIPF